MAGQADFLGFDCFLNNSFKRDLCVEGCYNFKTNPFRAGIVVRRQNLTLKGDRF